MDAVLLFGYPGRLTIIAARSLSSGLSGLLTGMAVISPCDAAHASARFDHCFLLRLIEACKIFDIPSRLTRGGPGTSTMVYSFFTYLTGMKYFDLGYASVQGFVLLVAMMIIVIFFFKRMRDIYR